MYFFIYLFTIHNTHSTLTLSLSEVHRIYVNLNVFLKDNNSQIYFLI